MPDALRSDKGSAAIDRALELFVALVERSGDQPLSAIAAGLGVPLSTAHRLMAPFLRRGLIVRTQPGRYVAGLGLSQLMPAAGGTFALASVARPIMKRLVRETQVDAHLGVLEDEMVTYVIKESGGRDSLFTREGVQLEAYCSAIGKILLAHSNQDYLDNYLSGDGFIALTRNTVTDPVILRRLLDRVRRDGFAVDAGEIVEDLNCVAVPVRDGTGAVIAAMSLSTSRSVTDPDRLRRALFASADLLSARLGWTSEPRVKSDPILEHL
jgi:IclR family transcriptional regulator, acetate operon repressor